MTGLQKVAAIAGSAVVFTVVAYGTKRVLQRVFERERDKTVIFVHAQDIAELEEGDG